MKKVIALLVVAAVCLLASPASADVVTRTIREHNATQQLTNESDPCFGSISGELTFNSVFHVTRFTSGPNEGTRHVTFKQTGSFEVSPDGSSVTYTGHFAMSGGFSVNADNRTFTFAFNVEGIGSDGSRVREHSIEHFNLSHGDVKHHFSFETNRCPTA
jgi:opacity protein-like surface antigen